MFLTDFQSVYEYAKPKYENGTLTCLMKPRWGPLWPSAWSAFEPKFRTFPPGGPPLRSPRGSRNRSVIYSPISQHKTKWDLLIGFKPTPGLQWHRKCWWAAQLSGSFTVQSLNSVCQTKLTLMIWHSVTIEGVSFGVSRHSNKLQPPCKRSSQPSSMTHRCLRQAFLSGTLETSYTGNLMSILFGNDRCR